MPTNIDSIMAKNDFISADIEKFFTSLTALFNEIVEKGQGGKRKSKYTRTQIVNYLAACGKTTNSKARATNPITLPDGTPPTTSLAHPPAWIRIDEKERRCLEKCGNSDKFIETLRVIVSKQNQTLGGQKRTGRRE